MDAALAAQNRQTMTKLLVIAVAMLGFGFAMVPMYRQICESLGLTQNRVVSAANTQVDGSRTVTIELDANAHNLPWSFRPLVRHITVHPGELATVEYEIAAASVVHWASKNSANTCRK
mgnify:CR=1 FL=1